MEPSDLRFNKPLEALSNPSTQPTAPWGARLLSLVLAVPPRAATDTRLGKLRQGGSAWPCDLGSMPQSQGLMDDHRFA